VKPSHKELYPTCSVASSASSEAADADNHKFGCAEGFQPNYCPGSAAPDLRRPLCQRRRRVHRFIDPGEHQRTPFMTTTVSFLRQTAGRSKGSSVSSVMAAVALGDCTKQRDWNNRFAM
jgi:hypothetical protein